jgi:perosamine synthetase
LSDDGRTAAGHYSVRSTAASSVPSAVNPRDELRMAIAALVGVPPEHVTLFWKGRVALYGILRALGIGRGDEVIMPAFTCVAVPNAVIYAGASPVYVDIDERTYTPDPAAVAAAIGPRTRAVLGQNTFGLSSDLSALWAVAAPRGAVVLDDCAHGLGGTYRGRPNGAVADAAFFSTQWTKPMSTGLGGIAVTRNPELAAELRTIESAAAEASVRDKALLRAMLFARNRVATRRTIQTGRALYRGLSRVGVVPGSSSRDEIAGESMPPNYLRRMSPMQARLAERGLKQLRRAVLRRRTIAARYSEWLAAHGCTAAHEPTSSVHTFLRYPLRVRERDRFVKEAAQRRIDLGDWFQSPLHPATGDLTRWGYRWGSNPVAERVTAEIVNLPTDLAPDSREHRAIEQFLGSSIERII